MKFSLFFVLLILLIGCSTRKYPIPEADLSPDYYFEELSKIDALLRENPEQVDLRKRRLFINDKLLWPQDAREDLNYLKENEGLSLSLFEYATDFFLKYKRYEQALDWAVGWEHHLGYYSPQAAKLKVSALSGLNRDREANHHLWSYVQQNKSSSSALEFAGGLYLQWRDTSRSAYAYNLLAKVSPYHEDLREKYVPLLLESGYPGKAKSILLGQEITSDDWESNLLLARALYDMGETQKAHHLLSGFDEKEIFYQKLYWHQHENSWDSALWYADKIITLDSSTKSLVAKAEIYEDRGRLSSALDIWSMLYEKDITSSIARERILNLNRKMAYLRRLREEAESRPILEISPKKVIENE